MIVSNIDRQDAILADIISVLSELQDGDTAGNPLLFDSVYVSSKPSPAYDTNVASCIIVPGVQPIDQRPISDDISYVVPSYDLYVSLLVMDWPNLSEFERIKEAMRANNLIRNALYTDRYRSGNATLRDKDIDGTYVGMIQLMPSTVALTGKLTVQCAFVAESATI